MAWNGKGDGLRSIAFFGVVELSGVAGHVILVEMHALLRVASKAVAEQARYHATYVELG